MVKRYRHYFDGFIFIAMLLLILLNEEALAQEDLSQNEEGERIDLVIDYANRILEQGMDQWSGEETPLFADGINVYTGDPVKWIYNNQEYTISNMASQQNLFRMFTGLSNLSNDETYRQAAMESIQYHFDNLLSPSGLLQWGGHQFIDLETLQPANQGNGFDSYSHEFKNHFPFYDLMRDVDPQTTAKFLRAFWNAHINDWEVLDMNRHGPWNRSMGDLWNHQFTDPDPFFEDRGLTFINAGSDLIYAGSLLYDFQGENGAIEWAKNLHSMYIKARHPNTGLGAYQFSKPERREEPPSDGSLEDYTNSRYGDRAENQFGNVYGDVAREGWVLWGGRVKSIYVNSGYMLLGLAEMLGENGNLFLDGVVDGLKALAANAYVPDQNHFRPMWADGTDLTGETYPRTGYYGTEGTEWNPLRADMDFLKTYARAYRLSGDDEVWQTARQIASGLGLGEIGTEPGSGTALNMQASGSGYQEIYALLELYLSAPEPQYIERAEIVADRMISAHFHNGFFMQSHEHVHANFDRVEPLAILALEAVKRGESERVPAWNGGQGYIHGEFDGLGRTYDSNVIWSVTMDEAEWPVISLIQPSEGEVVKLSPEFTWEQATFADQYQIQLTGSNFSSQDNILLDSTLTSNQLYYPGELEPNESYRWRVRAVDKEGEPGLWSDNILFYTQFATSGDIDSGLPSEFRLIQNFPNPFNPATSIEFELPFSSHVNLRLYDMAGREVAILRDQNIQAGYHTIQFDASSLASGIYIYQIRAAAPGISGSETFNKTRKMTLIK